MSVQKFCVSGGGGGGGGGGEVEHKSTNSCTKFFTLARLVLPAGIGLIASSINGPNPNTQTHRKAGGGERGGGRADAWELDRGSMTSELESPSAAAGVSLGLFKSEWPSLRF